MALTNFGVANALAVKLWSKKLDVEVLKDTEIADYIGEDSNSLIQVKTETQKSAGDQITFGLRMQLSSPGVLGDNTLEGNEEELATYSDAVVINQLRTAVRSSGKMSEQRVPFDVRKQALDGLKDWWADRLATAIFNQLAGNTAATDTRLTGNQATITPEATHWIWAGAATTDATLGAADTISLRDIDRCREMAQTLTPGMRPIMVGGQKKYVLFVHPYQAFNLRVSAAAAGSWFDIQKAAIQGGAGSSNPIYNGAMGEYNNTIIRVDSRVPLGATTTTAVASTRRAIFCGAQAGVIAFGQDNGPGRFGWVEKMFDYDNSLGVSSGSIFGIKKVQFNSLDFGVIVLSTYAAAH
jgi:N4-gp56 family major capsid protein